VDAVKLISELATELTDYIKRNPSWRLFTLHDTHICQDIYSYATLGLPGPNTNSTNPVLKAAINQARLIKTPYEIALIKKANDISSYAHRKVMKDISKLKNETEVEGIFTGTCITQDAKRQAYNVIAASGINASTLHYDRNNSSLKGVQLLCLDAGCEWNLYASDITRTYPVSGKFSKEAKEIYDLVEKMQNECIESIKPGVFFVDLYTKAHKIAIDGLLELGIFRNAPADKIYDLRLASAFFPHGLGHNVGLEVHDPETMMPGSYAKQTATHGRASIPSTTMSTSRIALQEGMVITIEPGM
jgi:Xaa-Pro dipeptidase